MNELSVETQWEKGSRIAGKILAVPEQIFRIFFDTQGFCGPFDEEELVEGDDFVGKRG